MINIQINDTENIQKYQQFYDLHPCAFDRCTHHRLKNWSYCFVHKCKVTLCNDSITLITTNQYGSYCENHICQVKCCKNTKIGLSYCESHKCLKCENITKLGSKYCVNHKCVKCPHPSNIYSNFCIYHICKSRGCYEGTLYGSFYCHDHICKLCGREKKDCELENRNHMGSECIACKWIANKKLCYYHSCNKCGSKKLWDQLYCDKCCSLLDGV